MKLGGKAPSKSIPSHDRLRRLLVSNDDTLRSGAPPPPVTYDTQEPKTSLSLVLREGYYRSREGQQPVACPRLYLKALMKPSGL
jgi:hypothetical protein